MVNNVATVDTVTLIGGPAKVNVSLDFGAQGTRGSLILYGIGKPSELPLENFSFAPQLLDWYINLKTSDSEYLYLYQYVSADGISGWSRIFKIIPNIFNTNLNVDFVDGIATVNIPITNTTLALLPGVTFSDLTLNVHVDLEVLPATDIEDTFPMIPGFRILGTTVDEFSGYTLDIMLTALEVGLSGMVPVTGTRIAHISINVIGDNIV